MLNCTNSNTVQQAEALKKYFRSISNVSLIYERVSHINMVTILGSLLLKWFKWFYIQLNLQQGHCTVCVVNKTQLSEAKKQTYSLSSSNDLTE